MLWDISKLVSGEQVSIAVPEPMQGSAPLGYISLDDATPLWPAPLGSGSDRALSRRIQSYNMKCCVDNVQFAPIADNASDCEVDDVDSIHGSIDDIVNDIESMTTQSTHTERIAIPLTEDIIRDNVHSVSEFNPHGTIATSRRRVVRS